MYPDPSPSFGENVFNNQGLMRAGRHEQDCVIGVLDDRIVHIAIGREGRLIRPLLKASLIADYSRSAARTKMSGERGSPYRTPRRLWNCRPGTPLRSTEDRPEEKIVLIHDIHLSLNPICFMMLIIASCSIVSKALEKSNFRRIICRLDAWH